MRFEQYDDFGDTLDGKFAARPQVAPRFALRGALSTGFRVPTAGQANLRNVTTEFNQSSGSGGRRRCSGAPRASSSRIHFGERFAMVAA